MKTIHIHLGPHKTGSSSIQAFLAKNRDKLEGEFGIFVPKAAEYQRAAHFLAKQNQEDAKIELKAVLRQIEDADTPAAILSSEDFSGDLPGRTPKRRPYPQLLQNIRAFERVFSSHRCIYYFFVREKDPWLHSAYVQNLKHRNKFSDFNQFVGFIKHEGLWEDVLKDARKQIGPRLNLINYSEESSFSSTKSLMELVVGSEISFELCYEDRENSSPKKPVVTLLELINKASSSSDAKRNAKKWLLEKSLESDISSTSEPSHFSFPSWPPHLVKPEGLSVELAPLWERCDLRVVPQIQPDLLPDTSVDLANHRLKLIEEVSSFPDGGRGSMENQQEILKYRFQGQPETSYLLGLSISYLRRDTEHTEKAQILFQRLWAEENKLLLATLATRWIISSLQTFMEHGVNENQRMIGASGFFFANMMKAYETERAIEGLEPDATYSNVGATTRNGFSGLDRFQVGGSDLLLNTLAHLLELASKDHVAGIVLEELLLRVKENHSIFSRMDQSRKKLNANVEGFLNCWSFFEEPRD